MAASEPFSHVKVPDPFTIGVDFGTNSARAIVVSCADGRTVGTSVADYHSGDHGVLTHPKDPHLARQNPADYIGALGHSVSAALAQAATTPGFARDRVIGIGVDTTGSTPLPIDARARPLAIDPQWESHLAAQAWLWKDHTGAEEAAAITAIATRACAAVSRADRRHVFVRVVVVEDLEVPEGGAGGVRCRRQLGGARRFRARGARRRRRSQAHRPLHVRRRPQGDVFRGVGRAAVERISRPPRPEARRSARPSVRSRAAAGHTGGRLVRRSGRRRSGCAEGIAIAMGGFDAHYGAVGSGIEVGTLVKIIGTSTCDCAIAVCERRQHPGHLRHRQRLDHARLLRHRGGAVGGRRHPQVVGRGCVRGRRRAPSRSCRARRRRSNQASRACSRSTGTTATARSSSIRS